MFAQCVAPSLVAAAEILGVAVVYAALVVGPVVEPARIFASDEVAVSAGRLAPGLGLVAERVCGAAVAVDTGVVSCAAEKIDGSGSAAAPVEVDILDFEVWRELFAAEKKLDWAAFAGRAVAVTRRAVGTSAAAGDAVAVAGTAAVAADTLYSAALSVLAGAAIHSPAVYTARQLAASDDLQTHSHPSHIPDKPSASPRTAPSVAVEDTPAAAVALVVVVEASYSIAAAAAAAVAGL